MDSLRVPPQAVEVEKHVIGAMMLDGEALAVAVEQLKSEDFYLERNRVLFETLSAMFMKGMVVDALTLFDELKKEGKFARAGGEVVLLEISREVVSAASIEEHCRIVREKFLLRSVISAASRAVEEAYKDGAIAEDVLAQAETAVFSVSERATAQTLVHVRSALASTLEHIQYVQEGAIPGIPSGLSEFDKFSGGFRKKKSTIVAGRPGMGKSALAFGCAKYAASGGYSAAFFSLEMGREELGVRMLGAETGIHNSRIDLGRFQPGEHDMIAAAAHKLSGMKLWIDDSQPLRPIELMSKCKRLKAREGLDIVFVDYLQLMEPNEHRQGRSRENEVSECSRWMKRIAMELDVAVVCLSQLSRETEKRGGDKRPVLSDLRESGAIEQDADVVLFVHRPDYYDPNAEPNLALLICAKGRGMPKFDAKMTFIPHNTAFVDYKNPESASFMHGAEPPRTRYGD